ncbi:MAG: outer membrane protein assembly factor BamD [Alphaproteobacteria bacterium]|nr:outer membrane protein assembly factor BamD [Alphaproteobacteria bacterium]
MMKLRIFLATLCLAVALTGCASSDKKTEDGKAAPAASPSLANSDQEPVEALYNRAARRLDEGKYAEAARLFNDVDRQYPYSQWAVRAQLMSGYAHYKHLRYDEAIIALDHYIELHPGDENAAYAWYLKALCFYEQITDVRRDQKMTELALDSLRQVVQRYPNSKYARDAGFKIDLTKDHLAGKEMEIGRYYLDRRQYQAAINRFQRVVTRYQTTTHVPEALHRLVESWLALGVVDEARKSAAILGHNHPESRWYKDTYALIRGGGSGGSDDSVFDKFFN